MGIIFSDEYDYSGSKDESDIKDNRLWTLESQFDPRTYGDTLGIWICRIMTRGWLGIGLYHFGTTADLGQS